MVIWDLGSGTVKSRIDHGCSVWAMVLIGNNQLAVAGLNTIISVYNLKTKEVSYSMDTLNCHSECVNDLILSDD